MAIPPDDPRPTPPTRPELEECCRGGCDPCVFDLYRDELARYEATLRQWELRHPGCTGTY